MFIDKRFVTATILISLIVVFYLSGLLKFTIVDTDSDGNIINDNKNDKQNNEYNNKVIKHETVLKSDYDRKVQSATKSLQNQLKQLEDKFYYDNSRFDLVYSD